MVKATGQSANDPSAEISDRIAHRAPMTGVIQSNPSVQNVAANAETNGPPSLTLETRILNRILVIFMLVLVLVLGVTLGMIYGALLGLFSGRIKFHASLHRADSLAYLFFDATSPIVHHPVRL